MNEANSILGEKFSIPEGGASESHVTSGNFTKFEHVSVGVLYLLFCVVGVSSNLITALAFYKDTGLLKGSKPWLHICLALANVAVVAPSVFPASSSFSGRWLYGDTVCQFYAFEGMLAGVAAIGAVIGLCFERYVVNGSNTQRADIGWFYSWSLLTILGNALFWAIMPLLGWSKYAVEHTGVSCAIDWVHPDHGYISYIINLEVFSFAIPMIVAGVCLYRAKGENQTAPAGEGQSGRPSGSAEVQGQRNVDDSPKGFGEDQLKSLCYVFIIFVLVGWGPFAFLCTATMVSGAEGLSMLAGVIPPLACKLMVSAYPLTYALTSARFRRGFLAVVGAGSLTQEEKRD